MDHADHVALLRSAVKPGGSWADIGAGHGAFTLALADLLGPGGRIVAVDRDARALRENERSVRARFPAVELSTFAADLGGPLDLPELDGLVAANSLHYIPRDRQVTVIRDLAAHLRPAGRFVVVEYDADRGNPWVPHPFSYPAWERLAEAAGLVGTRRIGRVPSRFLDAIYAAESRRPTEGAETAQPGPALTSVSAAARSIGLTDASRGMGRQGTDFYRSRSSASASRS
ncbi:MAG: class I SAM-dependent methyltransferase [Chloroflexota bacterium]